MVLASNVHQLQVLGTYCVHIIHNYVLVMQFAVVMPYMHNRWSF